MFVLSPLQIAQVHVLNADSGLAYPAKSKEALGQVINACSFEQPQRSKAHNIMMSVLFINGNDLGPFV